MTGVQTCALPIFALNNLDANEGLYSLDVEKDPLTGIERRSIDSRDRSEERRVGKECER